MIKVLIADDHKILRDGLRALLSHTEGISVVGECEDGNQIEPLIINEMPDVILMDIRMKDMGGIEATEYLVKKYKELKIIALSMHNEDTYIQKILKAGASGYILKNTGENELVHAIRSVYEGHSYFSEEVTGIMMSKYMKKKKVSRTASGAYFEDLTTREKEVLTLISKELTNNMIADKLNISSRTVDSHRRNLLQKLGVKNTAGLVRLAIQNNLLDEE